MKLYKLLPTGSVNPMDPRAVPSSQQDRLRSGLLGQALCPLSPLSISVFTICYSELLNPTALRFALFINSILVVIGEINEFCLSSLVKGAYLTMRLSMEKFRSGIKLWFWKYSSGGLNCMFTCGSYSSFCKNTWRNDIFERILILSHVQVLQPDFTKFFHQYIW